MAIEFNCPVCGGTLRVDDGAVGQVVRCGGCLSMLRTPDPKSNPSEFPDAPATPFAEPESPSSDAPSSSSSPPRNPDLSPRNAGPGERRPARRKHTRTPTAPLGRSPLFWVVIAFSVLAFGSCLLCCGVGAWFQDVHWRTVNFPRGGFQINLPAAPTQHMNVSGWEPQGWTIEGARMMSTGEEFAVLYRDIEPSHKRGVNSDEALLKKTLQDRKSARGVKHFEENKQITEQCGFPAREFQYQDASGESYVVRVIVADTRMYILVVCDTRQNGWPDAEDVQQFFDSFEITDEKLREVATERKELARRLSGRREEEAQVLAMGQAVGGAFFERLGEGQTSALGKALGAAMLRAADAERGRVRLEEERRVGGLGETVAAAPWRLAAAEHELARARALGSALAGQTLDAVEAEGQRLKTLQVGRLAGAAAVQAVASEQATLQELRRAKEMGVALGASISAAVSNALKGAEKP